VEFTLSDDAVMIQNVAREYLRERCTGVFLREMACDETGFSRTMWKEIAELGWLGILFDEAYGGSGASFLDMFVLCEEIGKVLFPSPLFCSAVLSGLIISEAGDEAAKKTLLPPLVAGERIFTTALLDEGGNRDFEAPDTTATEVGAGTYVLQGTRLLVPYAHVADALVVCAQVEGAAGSGPTLFVVEKGAGGMKMVPLETLSAEKSFAVVFGGTEVPGSAILGAVGQGNKVMQEVIPRVVALKCGEMLGGLERVVEMTVAHVKERRQFGAPLGTLQAVQHHCADLATYLETARLLAYQAASLMSDGLPCRKEVSMAKAWCSDVYKKATWIAQQLHGGIGFTEEYDLHFFYKHAKEAELAFGDGRSHRARVADAMGI
jgi:3-oxocholest-4-en-26-oyl-CoA dehydrogenase beta subunit